jgi:hypothetical protein
VSDVEILLQAFLEGGKRIEDGDQLSMALRPYIPVLKVSVRLFFKEFSRSNLFTPQAEFQREIENNIWSRLKDNAPLLATNTNALFNPLPPCAKICCGAWQCVRQPSRRCSTSGCSGCLSGCQLGIVASLSGISAGTSELFFCFSRFLVLAMTDDWANSSNYDVYIRPCVMVFSCCLEISKAVAESSTRISDDLLNEDELPEYVREARSFTQQGRVLLYGPGNYPRRAEMMRELRAASAMKEAWRRRQMRKGSKIAQKQRGVDLLALAKSEQSRAATREGFFSRIWNTLTTWGENFQQNYKDARNISKEEEGESLLGRGTPSRKSREKE